jgi:hypothetical protein
VKYDVSLWPNTKAYARHYCYPKPKIRLYLHKITKIINERIEKDPEKKFFEELVEDIIYLNTLERVCLACRLNNRVRTNRGLGKIRIQGRCREFKGLGCKMMYATNTIFYLLDYEEEF